MHLKILSFPIIISLLLICVSGSKNSNVTIVIKKTIILTDNDDENKECSNA